MKKPAVISAILLSTTFLTTLAWAEDITTDYLNSLTSSKISWSDSEGTEVTIGDKTFYYTYNKPEDYTETSTRINAPTSDITGQLFTGISNKSGGAVYSKQQNGSDINIDSDFVANHGTSSGGAIYRYAPSPIKNISGTFVDNYVISTSSSNGAVGGAIYTTRPSSSNSIIDNLIGNFVGNYVKALNANNSFLHGGAVDNHGTINYLEANFIGNYAIGNKSRQVGGALHNGSGNDGYIGTIKGNFIGNYIQVSNHVGRGGGISNDGVIDKIEDSSFYYNYVNTGMFSHGGAIYNGNTIGEINNTDFVGNSIENGQGGAIANSGTIGDITNSKFTDNQSSAGGAILNQGSCIIGNISGDFIGNRASNTVYDAFGGAIANTGIIGDVFSNFSGNYAEGDANVLGGAIFNGEIIGNISGDISDNHAKSTEGTATGGAIFNTFAIGKITGDNVENNYAEGTIASGGAIYNGAMGNLGGYDVSMNDGTIQHVYQVGKNEDDDNNFVPMSIEVANIEGNYVHSTQENAYGGAIYNVFNGTVTMDADLTPTEEEYENSLADRGYVFLTDDEVRQKMINIKSDSAISLINTSFINNHARSDSGRAFGGAIYSEGDVNIIANDGKTSLFSGNTANDESNAVYMKGTTFDVRYVGGKKDNSYDLPSNLNLTATNNGVIQFDDGIDGDGYNINISGDGTGVVKFNNIVNHVTNFTLGANSITHLGLNSKVYAQNMNISSSDIPTTGAVSSPIITVDVEVDKANNKVNTGQIYVDNDVEGEYRVLVNSLNPDVLDNLDDAIVPFLFAPEDDESTASSFAVARVIGSPYLWDGSVNAKGETSGSTWYLNLTDEENPDYDDGSGDEPEPTPTPEPQPKPEKIYAPEVIAGIGLHEAAIEQTRSVVHNIKGKVAAGRELNPCCGIYDYNWNGEQLRNIWVLAQGESADIEKPIDMEAKVYAVEAGFDIQNDPHNTLGVFASYRKGEYDLSGKGKFHSSIGSEIDIDSYLAGLYYRYDRYLVWAFATLYGGVQEADVKTDDGIAKFDTDGVEFGASIEVGRTIPLANDLTLDPSVGLYYTQVNFDDADDNVGKHYEWDDIKHLEAELGAKLEKQFDNAKVYVKPSVIRTFTNGDSVVISGMNKASTYKDQTLGRVEIGGRYGFTDALSAYAWANYTFGSSYDAYALGAGLNYAW